MLAAPRALLACVLALLDAPPKALLLRDASLLGTCRLPTLFPPPLPRFAPTLLGLAPEFETARFVPAALRLLALDCCLLLNPFCCALACRVDIESPRAVPPYLFAVALSE
jgi:hypothetical protein